MDTNRQELFVCIRGQCLRLGDRAIIESMQNILPVLCFIAGFALAWLVLRGRLDSERRAAGHGAALTERARTMGRDPVAPRRGNGGHAGSLRLLLADHIVRRRGPAAPRPASASARGEDGGGGREDAARRLPASHRGTG